MDIYLGWSWITRLLYIERTYDHISYISFFLPGKFGTGQHKVQGAPMALRKFLVALCMATVQHLGYLGAIDTMNAASALIETWCFCMFWWYQKKHIRRWCPRFGMESTAIVFVVLCGFWFLLRSLVSRSEPQDRRCFRHVSTQKKRPTKSRNLEKYRKIETFDIHPENSQERIAALVSTSQMNVTVLSVAKVGPFASRPFFLASVTGLACWAPRIRNRKPVTIAGSPSQSARGLDDRFF